MTKQDSRAIQKSIGNLEEIQKKIREQIVAVDGVCSGARMKTFSENDPNGVIGWEIEQAEEGAIWLNAALASIYESVIFLQESIGAKVPPYTPISVNKAQQHVRASNKLPASKSKAGISIPKSSAKKNAARPIVKEVQT